MASSNTVAELVAPGQSIAPLDPSPFDPSPFNQTEPDSGGFFTLTSVVEAPFVTQTTVGEATGRLLSLEATPAGESPVPVRSVQALVDFLSDETSASRSDEVQVEASPESVLTSAQHLGTESEDSISDSSTIVEARLEPAQSIAWKASEVDQLESILSPDIEFRSLGETADRGAYESLLEPVPPTEDLIGNDLGDPRGAPWENAVDALMAIEIEIHHQQKAPLVFDGPIEMRLNPIIATGVASSDRIGVDLSHSARDRILEILHDEFDDEDDEQESGLDQTPSYAVPVAVVTIGSCVYFASRRRIVEKRESRDPVS
ncbi:MAG: hypothetical protein AAGJ83_07530 [Planctomycetota bacterium]